MVTPPHTANARSLTAEFAWLRTVVETRYRLHHGEDTPYADITRIPAPNLDGDGSIYQRFVRHFELTDAERLVLILALMPQVLPHLLEDILAAIRPEFASGHAADGVTIDTALFLLAGDDLETRFFLTGIFDPAAVLVRENILLIDDGAHPARAAIAARLSVSRDFVSLFTTGRHNHPPFSEAFPARLIRSDHDWADLVLAGQTRAEVEEVSAWARHGATLLDDWGLGRRFAPGYTCLFHGLPGTGKTMTAALLGKQAGLEVFLVDMSMVVSRYVGETSKNLGRVFDQARNKPWMLFFDECESLFSKRSEGVKDAHDRWSNQEISYLLQRVEDHPGICILATNRLQHIDEAFLRRFQGVIEFSMPAPAERLRIWRNGFSDRSVLEDAVDLDRMARDFELAGGAIMNVIRYASLIALERGGNVIYRDDLMRGIRRELRKEGRTP